jgi:hypothetical protein
MTPLDLAENGNNVESGNLQPLSKVRQISQKKDHIMDAKQMLHPGPGTTETLTFSDPVIMKALVLPYNQTFREHSIIALSSKTQKMTCKISHTEQYTPN